LTRAVAREKLILGEQARDQFVCYPLPWPSTVGTCPPRREPTPKAWRTSVCGLLSKTHRRQECCWPRQFAPEIPVGLLLVGRKASGGGLVTDVEVESVAGQETGTVLW